MRYADFIFEVDEGVATVRLDNPDKLNAMSFQTYEGLERLTRELAHDDKVKVLVLTGTGRGFSRCDTICPAHFRRRCGSRCQAGLLSIPPG